MLRKITVGLVAAASLGTMELAPSTASAGGGGGFPGCCGGWGFHHHFHPGISIGLVGGGYGDGCYVTRRVLTPYGYRFRTINVCGY